MTIARTDEELEEWHWLTKYLEQQLSQERADEVIQLLEDDCLESAFVEPAPTQAPGQDDYEFALELKKWADERSERGFGQKFSQLIPNDKERERVVTMEFVRAMRLSCPNTL